jgi:cell division protein FtsA
MEESGFAMASSRYVILTGGGSQYCRAAPLAAQIFGLPARMGAPAAIAGLPPQLTGPSFAAMWGALPGLDMAGEELAARFGGSGGLWGGVISMARGVNINASLLARRE